MLGLIGKKIGMTQVFEVNGDIVPVTIIKVDKNTVIGKKIKERDGYNSLILGYEDLRKGKVLKVIAGQFKDDIKPKKFLKEFKIENLDEYNIGSEIGVELFQDMKFVDVTANSKGKGFQGVVKRYGFGGGRATHGSKFHRQNGSTGQKSYPSRVLKGVKRAGRMGNDTVTVQSLKVVKIDNEKGVMLVKGAVPGTKNSLVYINSAKKKTAAK
ncbi:MAG: 50S ribosomal protein L3 [Spirochaetes bacterium]|nr:50S ribosomal protein L3 [Spirochaetota bacterium]